MLTKDELPECPVATTVQLIGSKWKLLILRNLMMRSMEEDGLITRTVYPEVPPRVEYCLTELGTTLMPHIEALVNWAVGNMDEILTNRQTAGQ